MKMMNLLKLRTLMPMLIVGLAMFLGSCKDDKKDTTTGGGDKTALNVLITDANAMVAASTTAEYPQTAIDAYKATLKTVTDASSGNRTQVEINNLVTQLNQATTTFKAKAYGFIDETLNLSAGWHFDEGTGTTAVAYSPIKHIATFTKGNSVILGADAQLPTWVEGVKATGKAIYLNNGAHLEVPYNAALLPANLTISVWIKPIELYENNYIVSQNYWKGYKLQTQGGGKPFFTYSKAGGGAIDADNETDNSIKINVWNHIVVTLNATSKELSFYVNGTLTKTWTEATKTIGPIVQTLTAPDPQPFIIGGIATDATLATPDFTGTTAANLGYFKGAIDELKIYNIALTEGQISKLYTDEKP